MNEHLYLIYDLLLVDKTWHRLIMHTIGITTQDWALRVNVNF